MGRLGRYVLLGGLGAAFVRAWATARLAGSMIGGDVVQPGMVENLHGLIAPCSPVSAC